jgi:hypothetical protein
MKTHAWKMMTLTVLAVLALTCLRSTCGCKGSTAAKEDFFKPGTIKFIKVR